MGLVVAGLHVGAPGPLLQPGLSHAQRWVLGRNVGLEAFQVALLLGDFLKFGIRIKNASPSPSSIGSHREKNYLQYNILFAALNLN